MKRSLALASLMLLAACGKSQEHDESTGTATASAGTQEMSGQQVFSRCAACHAVGPNAKNTIGPALNGIVGRKVASADGFVYSDAMKAKGGNWDEASLDAYISDPRKAVPGNKMVFAGISDAAQRKALIEYLKSQK